MNITCQEAALWLRGQNDFLILTHVRPDGDTIGCAAALCDTLRKIGKTAYVLPNPGVTSTYVDYMTPYLAPCGFAPATVVTVDIATLTLLPDNAAPYSGNIALSIDHHPSNEGFSTRNCLDSACAACGEILYVICQQLAPLDARIAELLYVAVSTDTGCFVYSNTTPNTHRVAASLMEFGDFYKSVNKRCFRTKSWKRLRLESMLVDGMELLDNGTVAIAVISLAMMAQVNATEDDAEDLAAFAGQIEGIRVSVTIRELTPTCCKISLRTDDSLNATRTCALLGGGGHKAAAGATIEATLPETKVAILTAIHAVQHENG